MTLKAVLDKVDGLSDDVKALYVEKDGKFYLDVEKVEDPELKKKVSDFRDKNIELMKDMEDLKKDIAKFQELGDIEKLKETLAKLHKIEEGKLFEEGKIEELLSKRTERMKKDFESQIKSLTKIAEDAKSAFTKSKEALAKSTIDNQIQIEIGGLTAKARKSTMEDIIARGRRVFNMDEEDKVVARGVDGSPLFGKDGVTPLTITEWAQNLPTEAGHFFEPSSGGGAGGGAGEEQRGKLSAEALAKLPPAERLKLVHQGKAK